jgi:hypothetical protein
MIHGSMVGKSRAYGRGQAFDIIRCGKTKQPWLGDDGYNNQLDYFLGSKHRKVGNSFFRCYLL